MLWQVPDAALIGGAFYLDSRDKGENTIIPDSINSVITGGYYTSGDGGGAEFKKVSGPLNDGASFQSQDGAWWELSSITPNIKMFGAICDATADDYDAIINCFNFSSSRGIIWQIIGTPMVDTSILIDASTSFEFLGSPGNTLNKRPSSYIVKGPSITGPALIITGENCLIRNGGVIDFNGISGDNIQIIGHSFRWYDGYSEGSSGNGFRIGEDGQSAPNTNMYRLYNCTSYGNANGFWIDDGAAADAAPNANSGLLEGCMSQSNSDFGLYLGNCFAVSITSALVQSNGSNGIYISKSAVGCIFIGGDSEANMGGASTNGADLYLERTDYDGVLSNANDNVTYASHGFTNDTPIKFFRLSSGSGLSASTLYYVINASTDNFQVSLTKGGAAVTITADGTCTFYKQTTHQTRGGHQFYNLNLGKLPVDLSYQTSSGWIIGNGYANSSGLRPSVCEGVFTPRLIGSTGGEATLTSPLGAWSKNGRLVKVLVDLRPTAFTATGDIVIPNMPFSAMSDRQVTVSVGRVDYLVFPGSRTTLTGVVAGTEFTLYANGVTNVTPSAKFDAAAQSGNFATAGRLTMSIEYYTPE